MKLIEGQILNSATNNLESLLRGIPGVDDFAWRTAPKGWDAIAEARVHGKALSWGLEATLYGQPGQLRPTLHRMRERLSRTDARPLLGLVCAPYLSADAARACEEAGVGYLDLCGNCRLVAPGLFIVREGRPNQFPERRAAKELSRLFTPKAARVLKVLLRRPERPWKLQEAADFSQVSLALTFKTVRGLEALGVASGRRGGFRLTQPEGLLRTWARHYRRREIGRLNAYALAPEEVQAWASKGGPTGPFHVLGGYSAAEYLAPRVNFATTTIYLDGDPSRRIEVMGLKPVAKGGNVELAQPADPWFFEDRVRASDRWITSPAQTYLDLSQEPSRGAEAAEAILKEFRPLTRRFWSAYA